jgi:hypothetical protein
MPRMMRALGCFLGLALFVGGCGPSDEAVDAGAPDGGADAGPVEIDAGPDCVEDDDCDGALVCKDGLCQRAGCTVGTEGCACTVGDRCGRGGDGNPLVCAMGICSSMTCPAGTTGCACIAGESCASGGDVCTDGYCVGSACLPGSANCTCIDGACDANLHCLDNTLCVDDDGYEGGPCLPTGRCNPGARCNTALDVCVYCEPGTAGCSCTAAGTCGDGLACNTGLCIPARDLPPASPVCYTPCRAPLVEGGVTRACAADGLMEGCTDGRTCMGGSCVLPGAEPPSCTTDAQCPEYQACKLGRCYSECRDNLDCGSGTVCHLRVCRVPCESLAGAEPCARGSFCDTGDGENGFCMPLADRAPAGTATPSSVSFTVDKPMLSFSNVRTAGAVPLDRTRGELRLAVTDTDGTSHPFTIRKIWQELTQLDGTVTPRVEARQDPISHAFTGPACREAMGECPLSWLEIGVTGLAASRAQESTFFGTGGCEAGGSCPVITISNAAGRAALGWRGMIEIQTGDIVREVMLEYSVPTDGAWTGTMHYFANFGDTGVATWAASANRDDVSNVRNGLIETWGAFRAGALGDGTAGSGWRELQAVLTATETGSWNQTATKARCAATDGACYPYVTGVRTYVRNLAASPIPSATTELPFGMALRRNGAATQLVGKIDSGGTLHYPGDPSVALTLTGDPTTMSSCAPNVRSDCAVFVQSMTSESVVGGRFLSSTGTCPTGYAVVTEPWVVDGFTAGTRGDATTGRTRTWCVDGELPYGSATAAALAGNRNLSGANPVPDGVARRRRFRVLDGALINQSSLFLLFAEELEGFTDGAPVTSYGYVVLQRQQAPIDLADADRNDIPDAFEGNTAPTTSRPVPATAGATCSPRVVQDLIAGTAGASGLAGLSAANVGLLVDRLLNGTGAAAGSTAVAFPQSVHYYCEDTGLFDGGPDLSSPVPCPDGSRITYFSTNLTNAQIAADACQTTAVSPQPAGATTTVRNCQQRLNAWRTSGVVIGYDLHSTCDPVSGVVPPYCDNNRLDLRVGKTFYNPPPAASGTRTYDPLQRAIDAAFRYRVKFVGSSGARVGFAPRVCLPNSDQIPYCYDPEGIEEVRDRIDCLLAVYQDDRPTVGAYNVLNDQQRVVLNGFLRGSFAKFAGVEGRDGFERLYAELLVMQGDEALTQALLSRFDLAAAGGASFRGELFEPGGINLVGVAGFEMQSLYRAVQSYQLALERLYTLGPNFAETLTRGTSVESSAVFLSSDTVTLHLERLIRASTQRTRAYAEIAKRYQRFNKPALARAVAQRAYGLAYLESTVIVELMNEIAARSTRANRPQIDLNVQQALRRYRMALLDMRDLYGRINDNLTYFGFEPSFVPFPPLDGSARGRNAFEVVLELAQQRSQFARMREDQALASNRSFQTDAAQFQSELVRLRNTYEAQLGELCGTFVAESDGRVYPAIKRYVSLSGFPQELGDPCGRLGNGQIHTALVEIQQTADSQRVAATRLSNIAQDIQSETDSVNSQCALTLEIADYQFRQDGVTTNLQAQLQAARDEMERNTLQLNMWTDLTKGVVCIPNTTPTGDFGIGCINEIIDSGISFISNAIQLERVGDSQERLAELQASIATTEAASRRWVSESGCDQLRIQSGPRMAQLQRSIPEAQIESVRARRTAQLAVAEVGRLYNEAQRRQTELDESVELLVDVESARNDPNVRVYRNDAVLNADIAFDDAVRMAYRATRVLEYYTSQTYPRWEQLFLIRMVGAGEYNLENYLLDLQNAFIEFEELYGSPDTRVAVVSLLEDVLQIPVTDEMGNPIGITRRRELMRERLRDVDMLDANGYLNMRFSTTTARLSPLTRNHKILYVEADMIGPEAGDSIGRIYLKPTGTGTIRGLDGRDDYYLLPPRTAVMNLIFGSNRVFMSSGEVYSNARLRDRPLVNSAWELVFNQRDEVVNQDIDLSQLNDLRLYVYYQDFTAY